MWNIHWAKLLQYSQFSRELRKFFCKHKHLSLITLNNEHFYGTAHLLLHARKHRITSERLFFSCTLLKLMCSITEFACLITELACSSLLIVTGLLACARGLTWAACIANTLWVLIARYVFTRFCCVHYLSISNFPVNVRIGKHICKGRGLIPLVTGPVVISHLSTNYTEFYFR